MVHDLQGIHFNTVSQRIVKSLQWRHNGRDSVSNHQPRDCLLSRLFRRRSKKTSKLCVTGLCAGNSPGPVNSPHKWPVTRKMFPFDDVIMYILMMCQWETCIVSTKLSLHKSVLTWQHNCPYARCTEQVSKNWPYAFSTYRIKVYAISDGPRGIQRWFIIPIALHKTEIILFSVWGFGEFASKWLRTCMVILSEVFFLIIMLNAKGINVLREIK